MQPLTSQTAVCTPGSRAELRKASAPLRLSVEEDATNASTTMRKLPSVPGKMVEETGEVPSFESVVVCSRVVDSVRALSFI
jgi:hypothetical protein